MNAFIFHGTAGYPQENWFPWLKEKLEQRGWKVFVPQFPTPEGQSVEAWFEVLKEYEKNIGQDSLMVGHSLGGVFLLKVLEQLKEPIKVGCFIGTPIGVKPILNYEQDSSFSGFSFNWPEIKTKAKHFIVFQSDNDPYVSLGNGEQLAQELGVDLSFIPGAGHFNVKTGYTHFEELLEKIETVV